jgi:uncharacterized protein (TIGR03437 family)
MKKLSSWKIAWTAVLQCSLAIVLPAQNITTFVRFNATTGYTPAAAALVQGTDGNFYGTNGWGGGATDSGTVVKITPDGTVTVLYAFCSQVSCTDGVQPTGLIQAADGDFYGTTMASGTNGGGTVFKLTPAGQMTTLYSFCSQPGCADGASPSAWLIQATDGNFYGTTSGGVSRSRGTVFKITPGGTLTTLYNFCSQSGCADGANPEAGLIQADDGSLYGTTRFGGASGNYGTVFKITPGGMLTTLHSFCSQAGCADGLQPYAGLIQASDGNFYGTVSGNATSVGRVFKITPGGTLTTLRTLGDFGLGRDGGLIQASDGNLYGTDYSDGVNSAGTVYKITLGGTLTTLYNFCSQPGCADGAFPEAGLVQGTDGNLYGTTSFGGANNEGTVFKLALASSTTPPAINQSGGVVSGANFQAEIAPGAWLTIFGSNLSPVTDTWANAIVDGNLPTFLDGVSVRVGGEPAYIYYISPTQIDALAPNVGIGTVAVTVTNLSGMSTAVNVPTKAVQPAFFQWGNYAVATTQNYSLAVKNGTFPSITTAPARPGDVIILWGTGFGPTEPSVTSGFETPSNTAYNTASLVTVTVGGLPATVYGAALAAGYAGLYQVAIQIPTSLASGDYPVIATVSGTRSSSTTLITVED